jgi:hypothetical protein
MDSSRIWIVCVVVVAAALFLGCAPYRPQPMASTPLLQRAVTKTRNGIRVTVAVPSDPESASLFGVSLATKGIQPVWLDIENHTERPYWFLPLNLDPDYFTPLEAANRVRHRFASSTNGEMRMHFLAAAMDPFVGPGQTVSGWVFTNLDRGVKPVNVDLIGRRSVEEFFFLVRIPGMRVDQSGHLETSPATDDARDVDEPALRAALETMPCCALTEDGTDIEDPLNFVLIGAQDDVFASLARTGWHVSEALDRGSALKTFWSYFFGSKYRYAPISSIYLLGRRQDLALQKTRETARERNHLRIWRTALRFEGMPVWTGQISRDIGLAFNTKAIVTHEVDPDVDEARDYLFQDMLRSQHLVRFGWVKGVGETPSSNPRYMADGTPFFTDGLRAVMIFGAEPTSFEDIQLLGWESHHVDSGRPSQTRLSCPGRDDCRFGATPRRRSRRATRFTSSRATGSLPFHATPGVPRSRRS